jgi:predicted nucleic acid-binding protein
MAVRPETIVLDNEAVVALSERAHRKHRAALAVLDGFAARRVRKPALRVVVPVAVRVEAGWDRTDPGAAVLNRVSGARDVELDGSRANRSTQLRHAAAVSVVDATLAQVAESAIQPAVILSSDRADMRRLAALVGGDVRVVGL